MINYRTPGVEVATLHGTHELYREAYAGEKRIGYVYRRVRGAGFMYEFRCSLLSSVFPVACYGDTLTDVHRTLCKLVDGGYNRVVAR